MRREWPIHTRPACCVRAPITPALVLEAVPEREVEAAKQVLNEAGATVTLRIAGNTVSCDYAVILIDYGPKKIDVIDALYGFTDFGMKEAKDLMESAPFPVLEGVSRKKTEEVKQVLEEAGATIEIR